MRIEENTRSIKDDAKLLPAVAESTIPILEIFDEIQDLKEGTQPGLAV